MSGEQGSLPSSSSHREAASLQSHLPVSIDQSHEYRLGAPGDLRELPLLTQYSDSVSPISPSWLSIEPVVLNILLTGGIHGFNTSFVQRFEPGDRPADSDWTILVTTKKKSEQDKEKWKKAVESILKIDGVSESHIKIEIMDPRAMQYLFLPQIENSFEKAWESGLEDDIIHALGNGPWRTMTLYNRGHTEAEARPTVTIGIKKGDAGITEWKATTQVSIKHLLRDFPAIHIAFIRSSIYKANVAALDDETIRWDRPPVIPSVRSFQGPVAMGSSIGVGQKSGTVGGYLTVKIKGKYETFGLTNHHVILDDACWNGKQP